MWLSKKAFKTRELGLELAHEDRAVAVEKTRNITRMPFGKYKGRALRDIPVSYLEWVRTTFSPYKHGVLINNINYILKG